MAQRTYKEKLQNIQDWVSIINYHWERLLGDLFDDKEFWDDSFHSMTKDDHWDWLDIEPALRAQYPESFRRYPTITADTEYLRKQSMMGKPVFVKGVKHKNFGGFRAWMNIKDVINDINGTPTHQYTDKERARIRAQSTLTNFERLFEQK